MPVDAAREHRNILIVVNGAIVKFEKFLRRLYHRRRVSLFLIRSRRVVTRRLRYGLTETEVVDVFLVRNIWLDGWVRMARR